MCVVWMVAATIPTIMCTVFSRVSRTLREATQVVTFLSICDKKCREGLKR